MLGREGRTRREVYDWGVVVEEQVDGVYCINGVIGHVGFTPRKRSVVKAELGSKVRFAIRPLAGTNAPNVREEINALT